ncbi:MAG: peptidoglycan DD-metalloendopeptidase family protein [Burkholderiales bacterium]|nr:peptidoglycan DD-metalloendopeptidase family protein [Burkholderiales bacterium]
MGLVRGRLKSWSVIVLAAAVLAGCASRSSRAPVEDRGSSLSGVVVAPGAAATAKPLPGAENAGKPGYYTVRPGDTVMRIGLDTGQNWRDIVRWNNLENPNLIEVGQVLRVVPPVMVAAAPAPAASGPVPNENGVITRPIPGPGSSAAPAPAPSASEPRVAAVPPAAAPAPAPATGGDDAVNWMWPATGQLIAGFDEARNKGLDIAGKVGDPVLAAADGRVVYAGAGLRGYGNLIILKHNNTYLTAYAHNQTLLVKEEQAVQRGQKIAEMGSSDADRVKLHFEIRRQGKPVDPARYLPGR